MDLRQRLGGVIGSNYFGNAICGAGRKWSLLEFTQLSMDDIALQINQSVSSISLTQAQDLLTSLDLIYDQEGDSVNEKIHIADPFGGILVTNLSRLPLKNLDCGAGVPKDFSILTKATNTIAVTKVNEDLFLNGCILKNNT